MKYETLIFSQNLSITCPDEDCAEVATIAYRWTFDDIIHPDNFLPKIVLDKRKGVVSRQNSKDDCFVCSCCALSFFDSEESAKQRFNGIPERNRKMLGYTHIAKGFLNVELGKATKPSSNGHFDFFEYENVDLSSEFKISCELN